LHIFLLIKDAGFVYESLRNKTNRVIWEKNFHETNPRNGYFKKISTNPNHDTGSLILSLRNESTKRIFKVLICESGFANPPVWIRKDSFRAIVLRIHKDSWGFVGFVKTGRIFGESVYETNPQNKSFENIKDSWSTIRNKSGFVTHDTKRIFYSQDSWSTIRYESMDSQNESMFLRISYTNPASLLLM
jgi:hypothetical protein